VKSITQHHASARTPGPARQAERTTRPRLRLTGRAHNVSQGGNPRRGGHRRRPVRRGAHRVGGSGLDGYVGYRIGWPVLNRGTSALLRPCPRLAVAALIALLFTLPVRAWLPSAPNSAPAA
jgi:hypothetical protein